MKTMQWKGPDGVVFEAGYCKGCGKPTPVAHLRPEFVWKCLACRKLDELQSTDEFKELVKRFRKEGYGVRLAKENAIRILAEAHME